MPWWVDGHTCMLHGNVAGLRFGVCLIMLINAKETYSITYTRWYCNVIIKIWQSDDNLIPWKSQLVRQTTHTLRLRFLFEWMLDSHRHSHMTKSYISWQFTSNVGVHVPTDYKKNLCRISTWYRTAVCTVGMYTRRVSPFKMCWRCIGARVYLL